MLRLIETGCEFTNTIDNLHAENIDIITYKYLYLLYNYDIYNNNNKHNTKGAYSYDAIF